MGFYPAELTASFPSNALISIQCEKLKFFAVDSVSFVAHVTRTPVKVMSSCRVGKLDGSTLVQGELDLEN